MLGLFFLDLTFRIDKNTVNQTSAGNTWGANLANSCNSIHAAHTILEFENMMLPTSTPITSTDDVYIKIIKIKISNDK